MSHKREIPRRIQTVRFQPDEMALIDAARGERTRQAFIAGAALAAAVQGLLVLDEREDVSEGRRADPA